MPKTTKKSPRKGTSKVPKAKSRKKAVSKLPVLFGRQLTKPVLVVLVFVAIGLGTLIYSLAATPTGAIANKETSRCLENFFDRQVNGNFLSIYRCNGDKAQQWTMGTSGNIYNAAKYCMDVAQGAKTPLAKVQLWQCTGGAPQKWEVRSDGSIRNPNSGLCLEAGATDTFLGGPSLYINTCNPLNKRQQWSTPSSIAIPPPAPSEPAPTNPTPPPTGSARPGPDNTGPTTSSLTPMSSAQVASEIRGGRRLFERVSIAGAVVIPTGASGTVTFRNFTLDAQNSGQSGIKNCYGGSGCISVVAEDGIIRNFGEFGAIADRNYAIRRVEAYNGTGDGFKAHASNVLIEGVWVHDIGRGVGAHGDFLQTGGGPASNIVVRGSYCNFEISKLVAPSKANSCYINGYDTHPRIVATFENNWLMGGNITMNCGAGSEITVRNNIMSRDRRSSLRTAACTIWQNNKYEDGSPAI